MKLVAVEHRLKSFSEYFDSIKSLKKWYNLNNKDVM